MRNFYIFSSCQEITFRTNYLKNYLEKNISRDNEDLKNFILEEETISLENLLNKLLGVDYIKFVPKNKTISWAKKNFEHVTSFNKNGIYIVNAKEETLDKLNYWEIGHALGKDIKVIGYCSEKEKTHLSDDLTPCIEHPVLDSSEDFLETILHYIKIFEEENPQSTTENWRTNAFGTKDPANKNE